MQRKVTTRSWARKRCDPSTWTIWTRRNHPDWPIVARDRVGLGVSDTLADILPDWLDTFESVTVGGILWVTFVMILSDAGKDENKTSLSNLVNDLEYFVVLHLHYP